MYSQPNKKGFLDAGDGHRLYYENWGNPKGAPVIFLHGGPGAGFESEKHGRFFDYEKYNVIFFDQRGAGKSTPFASTKNNTTDDLVSDINKVQDFFKLKKVTIFGGSWGSTLALVYAIRNPDRVANLVVYSIYLARKEDLEFLYEGGVKDHFVKEWERFVSLVPKNLQSDTVKFYLEQMTCGDELTEKKFAYEWSYYESALLHLKPNVKKIERELKKYDPRALSILEANYAINNNFIPENYILENAKILSKITVYITQGRYDFICKPEGAHKLHEEIPGSKFQVVTSGHSSSDREMNRALVKIMIDL